MTYKNVAFIGPLQGGKTTMAKFLAERYAYRRVSFADALREEVAAACAKEPGEDQIFLREMVTIGRKDFWRPILQWWGTELRRERFSYDYWIDRMAEKLDLHPDQRFVIDDCRFPNEYDMLLDRGFVIVRVLPNAGPTVALAKAESHVSESFWRDMNADIDLPWMDRPEERQLLLVEKLELPNGVRTVSAA